MLLLLPSAVAQDSPPPPPPSPTAEELAELRERIRRLEAQLDQSASPDSPTEAEIPLDLETKLHGYADVQLKTYEGQPLTFVLGDLTLSYDANLDRKVAIHTDVVFAVESIYAAGNDEITVRVDAMEIKARPTEHLEITAGRFYTPLSRWADNNFNGAFRYLTILLPEVLLSEDDEGSLPIHLVGLAADGRAPIGFWYLRYHLSASNGRSSVRGEVSQGYDTEWLKSPLVGLWLESPGGVVFGGAAFYDRINPGGDVNEGEIDRIMTEVTASASFDYKGPRFQALAEGFLINHLDEGEGTWYRSWNGYAQAGYRFKRTTPYLKVERMERPIENPYFAQMTYPLKETKLAAGVRYDLGIHAALKLEFSECLETKYDENGEPYAYNNPNVWAQLAAGF